MNEEEAKAWLASRFSVPRETSAKLDQYVSLLIAGMASQNLISESTRPHVWARHIVDSAQLIPIAAPASPGEWIDLGSGAGLPGIVIAVLSGFSVTMIEARRKRVEFLQHVIGALELSNAQVFAGRVEAATCGKADVISARAYAPLPKLFESAHHLSTDKTRWFLPKGRNAENELEVVRPSWQGVFHVERSVTDADSAIIVAEAVQSKGKRGRR